MPTGNIPGEMQKTGSRYKIILMEPGIIEYANVAAICFLGSFVQGTSGFGSALIAMPLLIMLLPARMATPLCVLMGLIITIDLTVRMRRHVDWHNVLVLTTGCLPGIAAGIYLLGVCDDILMRRLLGAVLACYAGYALFIRLPQIRLGGVWGVTAGFAAGTLGAALSTGGPPAIIYCTLMGWRRNRLKATLSAFFLVTSLVTVAAHWAAGFTTHAVLKLFGVSIAPVLAGTWLGTALYNRISEHGYIKILLCLLLGAGLLLVFS